MPTSIDFTQTERLISEGAQVVEVLPGKEYGEAHLPGAINLPLKELDGETASVLDRSGPVIVYCWDSIWDLSPRAACRLETLGFTEIYDYRAGKVDWLAHGRPFEGEHASVPRVGDHLSDEVVTCGLADEVGPVGAMLQRSPFPFGLVLASNGVILGRLRKSMLDCDPQLRAEQVMEAGPKTFRPHRTAADVAAELGERGFRWAIVTTPEGVLLGVATRTELEAAG